MPLLLHDIVQILAAAAVMPLLLFLPGYGITSFLFGEEVALQNTTAIRAWGVALSFATMPVLVYLAAVCGSLIVPAVLVLALDILGLRQMFRHSAFEMRGTTLCWTVVWFLFIVVELIDLPWHGHLYVSGTVLDHSYRVAFIQTIATHGVPPQNPLYFPGAPQPLRYYYFWYVLCALPVKFLHLEPHAVLIASCFAAGLALVCMVWLYVESLFAGHGKRIAIALLAVTGLDVLVVIANTATGVPLDIDPEWWSRDQVTSWIDTVLWVPHHAAALIAALTVLLLLWKSPADRSPKPWRIVPIAALGIASAFGLSTYIGVALVFLLAVWPLWQSVEGKRHEALQSVTALALSALPALPLLLELRAPAVAGSFPLAFGIREMVHVDVFHDLLASPLQSHPELTMTLLCLALLPIGYFVEFGAFAIVFLIAIRQQRRSTSENPHRRTLLFLTSVSLLLATFIHSTAIQNNDFGYRSILLTQFFLLLLTTDVLLQWRSQGGKWNLQRSLVAAMFAVGLISSIYQVAVLRLYAFRSPKRAEVAYDLRTGYERLQRIAGPNDVVAWEPSPALTADLQPERIEHTLHLLYARHQTAAPDADCGAAFGGDSSYCGALQRDMKRLSDGVGPAAADDICRRWGIRYLVATETEQAWNRRESWPWTMPPVIQLQHMRVLGCRQKTP